MTVEMKREQGYNPSGDEMDGTLLVGRCSAMGGHVYTMRPYDPSFLWILGFLHQLHDMTPTNYRAKLIQTQTLLKDFVLNEDNRMAYGLERVVPAVRMMLTFIQPAIEDTSDAIATEGSFEDWKRFVLMAFDNFENRLVADVEALAIRVLEEKRGYSVRVLLSDIEQVLPPDDRGVISEFAHDNMQEAGACLAYERYTACGYHMARAVEDVARRYNFSITGNASPYTDKNGDTRHRPLGQVAAELQRKLNEWNHAEEPKLLSLVVPTLLNFCRIYRNPLSHADPELKELKPNDAEIAFGHAITAISTMLEDGRMGGPHFKQLCSWR